ncbi:O-methyltransferase [Kitasatospora azatica]|uniref:O-methyltransferase n=1 Tax=Kitasatospora azatica TaxID=58347 RepID=UPI000A7F5E62|nr:class I SAM-dependent methyltransferase [Kitasatospora azatica]
MEEQEYLAELVRRTSARTILEIGFNAGLSSQALLAAAPDIRVVSFDLGDHAYVHQAKEYVDRRFPGRHELILGDSRTTLPRYAARADRPLFDLAFVDGGHEVEVARADLRNARALCRPGAHVVIDDLTPWRPWGVGPTAAWREAIADGLIVQEEVLVDGVLVDEPSEPGDRVWAWGRFL